MTPFDLRHIDHIVLRITDLERSVGFHGALLGCAVQNNFGAEGEGPSLCFDDPDGNTIELKGPAR